VFYFRPYEKGLKSLYTDKRWKLITGSDPWWQVGRAG